MNNLEKAADLLRNGWCTGKYKDDDKFCALGAIAAVNNMNAFMAKTGHDDAFDIDYDTMPEVIALSETIVEQYPEFEHSYSISERVYEFNDAQDKVDPVIAMFEKAAVKLDEKG